MSPWLWVFAIIAVSSFAGLIIHLDNYEKQKTNSEQHDTALGSATPNAERRAKGNKNETGEEETASSKFDFYSLLPKMKVEVPKPKSSQESKKENLHHNEKSTDIDASNQSQASLHSTTGLKKYFLQAGSFRAYTEADKLRARLALLGVESRIEKVELNAQIWHRVKVGPLLGLRELNRVRTKLHSENIDTLTLEDHT